MGLSSSIKAQLFDMLNKPMYEARVKLLDEFYARFNGKEQRKDVDKKYSDRKSNILMLLDFSCFKSKEDASFKAAEVFAERVVQDSVLLNYTDQNWFAKVKCHGLLAKKSVEFSLYLSVEERGVGMYKWVISDVEGDIFSTSRSIDHKELFLRPNDHEQSFASLVRTTEETSRYIDDFVKDNYESDALSVFLTLVRCGLLKIDYVSDVEFLYLQVPGYVFSVKQFERETMNAGWLISSIKECEDSKKVEMLNRLHQNPICDNGKIDTTTAETDNVLPQPKSISLGDSIPSVEVTDAEKVTIRFWENLRFWCETKDVNYRKMASKECYAREVRVNDSLMILFANKLELPQMNSYTLDSYMNGFQSVVKNGKVVICINNIKEISKKDNDCIVLCNGYIRGSINAEFEDLIYVMDGKILSIIQANPSE